MHPQPRNRHRRQVSALFRTALLGLLAGIGAMALPPDRVMADANMVAQAPGTDPDGGIGGTGITGIGIVQRFGSIFVNGREFLIDAQTRVLRHGDPVRESDLRLGDTVMVTGTAAAGSMGRAQQIEITPGLHGRIESVNAEAGTVSLLGEKVVLNHTTLSNDPSGRSLTASALRPGDSVNVAGYRRSDGRWLATRIDRATDRNGLELTVRVTGIDPARRQLTAGARTFYFEHIPEGIAPGQMVELVGTYLDGQPFVEAISRARPHLPAVGSIVEMSGIAQQLPGGRLGCQDIPVILSGHTEMRGADPLKLGPDQPIAVRGVMQPDGSVAADSITVGVDLAQVQIPSDRAGAGSARQDKKTGRGNSADHANPAAAAKADNANFRANPPALGRPDVPRPQLPSVARPDILSKRPVIPGRPAIPGKP